MLKKNKISLKKYFSLNTPRHSGHLPFVDTCKEVSNYKLHLILVNKGLWSHQDKSKPEILSATTNSLIPIFLKSLHYSPKILQKCSYQGFQCLPDGIIMF